MKPILQKINYQSERSFIVEKYSKPYFEMPWHFHSEYELVWITKGFGKRYVNENVEDFTDGDLVFLGSNLPHFWRSDISFYESKSLSESIFIMFNKNIFPVNFNEMTEYKNISKLLENSNRGFKISGEIKNTIMNNMTEIMNSNSMSSLNILMLTLDLLGKSNSLSPISNVIYKNEILSRSDSRLERVLLYINNNFVKEQSLDFIANLANMNSASFCRYFKNSTGKTFVQYINEIRLSYACKLLLNKDLSVAQVCYECGFNSLSFFYRTFKKRFDKTPLEYQREFCF